MWRARAFWARLSRTSRRSVSRARAVSRLRGRSPRYPSIKSILSWFSVDRTPDFGEAALETGPPGELLRHREPPSISVARQGRAHGGAYFIPTPSRPARALNNLPIFLVLSDFSNVYR